MCDVLCAMRDALCAMCDARCAMRDARCAMRDARCVMRGAMQCAMCDAIPDARCDDITYTDAVLSMRMLKRDLDSNLYFIKHISLFCSERTLCRTNKGYSVFVI